jgi:hypothetical protein
MRTESIRLGNGSAPIVHYYIGSICCLIPSQFRPSQYSHRSQWPKKRVHCDPKSTILSPKVHPSLAQTPHHISSRAPHAPPSSKLHPSHPAARSHGIPNPAIPRNSIPDMFPANNLSSTSGKLSRNATERLDHSRYQMTRAKGRRGGCVVVSCVRGV